MPQVPGSAFAVVGPWTVYTSPSGAASPITGIPYPGGVLAEGNYVDVTAADIADYQVLYGNKLYPGRYRFVRVSPNATTGNIAYGKPCGWGLGTSIANAIVAAAGSGYTIAATGAANGTVNITSSAAGGTAATASLVLVGGVITSVQVTYPGANMTSVPTFSLSELTGGTGGSVLAEQNNSPNFVSSIDASSVGLTPRGIWLTPITAAQITGFAWVWIQEAGIAPLLPTTASSVAAGSIAYVSATAAAVTVVATGSVTAPQLATEIGTTMDISNAGAISRVILDLSIQQG